MRTNRNRAARGAGFTLIEVMVVVIILGILAATIIPQFGQTVQNAKVTRAKSDIQTLENALERYYLTMSRYPSTEEGLRVLVEPPQGEASKDWSGPYVKQLPPDPWGNAYSYRAPGTKGLNRPYDLWSRGSDGADGGEGEASDLSSWTEEKKQQG
jgi:general secretion pathway protein G